MKFYLRFLHFEFNYQSQDTFFLLKIKKDYFTDIVTNGLKFQLFMTLYNC